MSEATIHAERAVIFVYHLRRRLAPKGGSQWYKDKRERTAETYCGAAPTAYDGDWRSKAPTFEATRQLEWDRVTMSYPEVTETRVPCAGCVAARRSHTGR